MIRWRVVLRFLSYVTYGEAICLLIPFIIALFYGDSGKKPLLLSLILITGTAVLMHSFSRRAHDELHHKESLLLVTIVWASVCVLGALPFWLSPYFSSFTDSLFESTSGFTTTGATVLELVENLPRSLQFWRCFTHWVGGMGIILLGVAILPLIGVGGMELYQAEFSGARSEKLTPRIAETAKALWKIYALLSILEYSALRIAGMDRFESICHTFSTMGTGGFSTRNNSIGAFQNSAIEGVIIVFMLLAGINFTLHYRLMIQRDVRRILADSELRFYLITAAAATLVVTSSLFLVMRLNLSEAFRDALFQVSSIMTTTGFSSTDFEVWPHFAQLILLALMFVGGCVGSTGGGLKSARILLLLKAVGRQFHRLVDRRGVFIIRLNREPAGEMAIQGLLNLVYLAFLVNFAASLILTACGIDIITSITAVAACMFNIGPGLGAIGPSEHYGELPQLAKWVLMFCMLAGRLEFYTMMVLLTPAFWRK